MKHTRKSAMTMLALLLAATAPSFASSVNSKESSVDIATWIQSGKYQYFWDSLRRAGHMEKMLHSGGPYTVFVPQDSAFDKTSLARWTAMWAKPQILKQVVGYGIVKGSFESKQLGGSLPTLEGHALPVQVEGSKIIVDDGARIKKADIKCSNGVIHVVDKILYPPQYHSKYSAK